MANLRLADSLYFLPEPTEEQDWKAIDLYSEVLHSLPDKEHASQYVESAERLGNLFLVYQKLEEAASSYRNAIRISRAYQLPDTLIYNSHLYLGETLFGLSKLDSSIYHLEEAERLQAQLNSPGQPERMFNALGVYYFETGNYIQSISYFTKAESFLGDNEGEYEKYARYSFLSNKASALYYLEEFDSARAIYQDLLKYNINTDQIRTNLANTYLKQNAPEKALNELKQIQQAESGTSLSYLNLLTKAYLQKGALSDVESTLNKAEQKLSVLNFRRKNYQKGIHLGLMADFYKEKGELEKALELYHKAVVQLHPDFESEDPWETPEEFALGMSSVSLFEMLVKKGKVAWDLYQKDKMEEWFELGLNTFSRAFQLANYISLNFDNDEARIFLGDQVLDAYSFGIDRLYDFSLAQSRRELMEKAFAWAEESKSSALRLGAIKNLTKRSAGIPRELLQQEQNLLFSISRNYQQQYITESPEAMDALASEYNDLQVALSRLRERFKEYTGTDYIPKEFSLKEFQANLDSNTGVLSLFQSETKLYVFWVGHKNFDLNVIPLEQIEFDKLNEWRKEIQNPVSGNRYISPEFLENFSRHLLGQFRGRMDDVGQLLIVPHGLFSSFPFELLPMEDRYLLEEWPIGYEYSALMVRIEERRDWHPDQVLAFAPFLEPGIGSDYGLSDLPGSELELSVFSGEKLKGRDASLPSFIQKAPKARFIHLATHAVASSNDPNAAFIAFYPESSDFRLFSQELSFQILDKTELVFLSACETGSGQLSKSEGLISLARSFFLAGSEQLVTSLWVSEDQASAYISSRFYHHLDEGKSYAKALQLAKIDLLSDPAMAQYSHPSFWANFILIGPPQEMTLWDAFQRIPLFVMVIIGGVVILFLGWIRLRRQT
ncbi:CHAT domain-containing protein [Algoriphagus sp. CAU 1675]|uniref:CHAT domain-containing protein n=1 Tax=Algoriphagus sp. CAU 1675 TaxID=3032597 RepID=UPI0023D98945|nr:CHAT domain-containing protein [Algoriphagus sp. CAU 1675]MDF2159282.1 CHAT domain-containing protein [Algoriphagus sp. CAU 1675]